ncbi:hypothetical protein BRAO375_4180015 [Bradyrhizobium sp. ORS 375]|nr:hypothetical protein BRAO375_4180015 [Bradyrhizobium sp. ORS 375]
MGRFTLSTYYVWMPDHPFQPPIPFFPAVAVADNFDYNLRSWRGLVIRWMPSIGCRPHRRTNH